MPTQNVNLPDHQSQFIRELVESGRYQNASEVVRAGLRLLEQSESEDQLRLKHLRRVARESFAEFDRGGAREHDARSLDELFERLRRDRRAS